LDNFPFQIFLIFLVENKNLKNFNRDKNPLRFFFFIGLFSMRSVLKDAYEALDYLKNTDIQLEGNVSKSEIGSKNSKDVNLKIDSKGILYFLDLLVSFQSF
jgi:hypothetical protein